MIEGGGGSKYQADMAEMAPSYGKAFRAVSPQALPLFLSRRAASESMYDLGVV